MTRWVVTFALSYCMLSCVPPASFFVGQSGFQVAAHVRHCESAMFGVMWFRREHAVGPCVLAGILKFTQNIPFHVFI